MVNEEITNYSYWGQKCYDKNYRENCSVRLKFFYLVHVLLEQAHDLLDWVSWTAE